MGVQWSEARPSLCFGGEAPPLRRFILRHSRRHFTRTTRGRSASDRDQHLPHRTITPNTVLNSPPWSLQCLPRTGWSSQDRRHSSTHPLPHRRGSSSSFRTRVQGSPPTSSLRPLPPPQHPQPAPKSTMKCTSYRVARVSEKPGAGSWADQEAGMQARQRGMGRETRETSKGRVPRRAVWRARKDG